MWAVISEPFFHHYIYLAIYLYYLSVYLCILGCFLHSKIKPGKNIDERIDKALIGKGRDREVVMEEYRGMNRNDLARKQRKREKVMEEYKGTGPVKSL